MSALLALAPALVVGSTLAGRRWGAAVTGTLVGLPIVAGPILLITTLDQGTTFGSRAASASLLGLVTLALFTLVMAWASRIMRWPLALATAWLACLTADAVLSLLTVPSWAALLAVLASTWVVATTLPEPRPIADATTPSPWWDLPARAAATAALVLTVTTAADALGPAATGILAPFPIATSVVAAFALAQRGPDAAVALLRGVPRGLTGFAAFCYLVAVLLTPFGVAAAFVLATAGALAVSGLQRVRRAAPATR